MQQPPFPPTEANQPLAANHLSSKTAGESTSNPTNISPFLEKHPIRSFTRFGNLYKQEALYRQRAENFAPAPGPYGLVTPVIHATRPAHKVSIRKDMQEDLSKSWKLARKQARKQGVAPVLMDAMMENSLMAATALAQHIRYKMNLSAAITKFQGGYAVHMCSGRHPDDIPLLEGQVVLPFNLVSCPER